MEQNNIKGRKFNPGLVILLSFVFVALISAIPLKYLVRENRLSFIDALFTSTSALCVTGLTVVDTGTKFNPYGHFLILFLIQIGGLGIMTISTLLILIIGKKLSIKDKLVLEESLGKYGTFNLKSVIRYIVLFTFSIEFLGTLLLFFRWRNIFANKIKALWFAFFHSVSAFCNAGFSLFPDNLIRFQNDIMTILIITSLIIIGGLGFLVNYEIKELLKLKIRKNHRVMSLNSKIVLLTTIYLIFAGIIFLNITEFSNILKGKNVIERLSITYFQSVTPRTAGFNTVRISDMSYASLLILIFLMFIGGSPGSTAGGIKTTTFTTILMTIKSILKGNLHTECFERTIPQSIVRKAIAIFFIGLTFIFISGLAILYIEQNRFTPIKVFFETFSAFGTVGLSTGITSDLKTASKIILIILMLTGRVGPMTIAFSIVEKQNGNIKYAEENIIVG